LRAHLRAGDACPVCTQTVAALPRGRHRSAVAAAEAAGATARTAAETATKVVEDRDRAFRELDRALAAARARADHIGSRLSELDIRLAGAPAAEAIKAEIAACAARERDLEESAAELRRSREAHRVANAAVQRAERDLRTAWREFDTVRDAVARFGPPAAERDDLPVAWAALQEWAQALRQQRRVARDAAVEVVGSADAAVEAVAGGIALLFETAGLPAPEAEHSRVAAVALERAEAAHRRVEERRAQAARLRDQRTEHERAGRVARTLAGHLRADRFERWLLAEALDALVDGASGILRELSGGQYDLGHDKGEFFVVDHHDAGLRRPVRTLSGGETFQASLALALALSEQLAGMSRATASLESILLDEGFGTLDPSTLDTVAATLENLAARGDRVVGVVTHVAALAERIPVRFEVRRDARSARVQRLSS
jgi:exonuclease SbcC